MKICSFLIKNNDFLLKMGFFFPILCKKFISIQNILYNFQQFVWLFPIKELFWKWDNRWSLRPNFPLGGDREFSSRKILQNLPILPQNFVLPVAPKNYSLPKIIHFRKFLLYKLFFLFVFYVILKLGEQRWKFLRFQICICQ